MQLLFSFSAFATDVESGAEIRERLSFDFRSLQNRSLDEFLDPELADLGVVGGDIEIGAQDEIPLIRIRYWLPERPADSLIEALRSYSVSQLEDGMGEGGFQLNVGGRAFVVVADVETDSRGQLLDDGRIVAPPSRIAIAARDGNVGDLARAIEACPEDLERLHQGHTPLQLAIIYGHVEAVGKLLAAGADANRIDVYEGLSPLDLCALSNSLDDAQSCEVAQMLLAARADTTRVSPTGTSAREYAAMRGKNRLVELLRSELA